jgi:hypothetical protein
MKHINISGLMVTFRTPQGEDRIIIPAGDAPEKHVRSELILAVQMNSPHTPIDNVDKIAPPIQYGGD